MSAKAGTSAEAMSAGTEAAPHSQKTNEQPHRARLHWISSRRFLDAALPESARLVGSHLTKDFLAGMTPPHGELDEAELVAVEIAMLELGQGEVQRALRTQLSKLRQSGKHVLLIVTPKFRKYIPGGYVRPDRQ